MALGHWAVEYLGEGMAQGGSGGGGLVVHVNVDQSTETAEMDKTWKEIDDMLAAGGSVSIDNGQGGYTSMVTTMHSGSQYLAILQRPQDSTGALGSMVFYADSPNGYPSVGGGGN